MKLFCIFLIACSLAGTAMSAYTNCSPPTFWQKALCASDAVNNAMKNCFHQVTICDQGIPNESAWNFEKCLTNTLKLTYTAQPYIDKFITASTMTAEMKNQAIQDFNTCIRTRTPHPSAKTPYSKYLYCASQALMICTINGERY